LQLQGLRADVHDQQPGGERGGDAPLAPARAVVGFGREFALQQVDRGRCS
jgi:hypothetical protein